MNYFPFHIGDWCASTSHLDDIEELTLFRMLRRYYRDEAPLPADVAEAARQVGARDKVDLVQQLLNEFFELADDGWHQRRADREIAAYQAAAAKGRAGARARWEQPELLAEGELSTAAPGNANQEPGTKNQKAAARVNKAKKAKTATAPAATAEAAATVCDALRAVGITDADAADPLLHELLAAGVPTADFLAAALRSGHADHPWRYALKAVAGRLQDSQRAPAQGQYELLTLYGHTVCNAGATDAARTQEYLREQELTDEQRAAAQEQARRIRQALGSKKSKKETAHVCS